MEERGLTRGGSKKPARTLRRWQDEFNRRVTSRAWDARDLDLRLREDDFRGRTTKGKGYGEAGAGDGIIVPPQGHVHVIGPAVGGGFFCGPHAGCGI